MSFVYCGAKGTPPSGKRFGTLAECQSRKQIRRYGIKKVSLSSLSIGKQISEIMKIREEQRTLSYRVYLMITKQINTLYLRTEDLIRKNETPDDHEDERDLGRKIQNSLDALKKLSKKITETINKINNIHDKISTLASTVPAREIPPIPSGSRKVPSKVELTSQKKQIETAVKTLQSKTAKINKQNLAAHRPSRPAPPDEDQLFTAIMTSPKKSGNNTLQRLKKLDEEKQNRKKQLEEEIRRQRELEDEEFERFYAARKAGKTYKPVLLEKKIKKNDNNHAFNELIKKQQQTQAKIAAANKKMALAVLVKKLSNTLNYADTLANEISTEGLPGQKKAGKKK